MMLCCWVTEFFGALFGVGMATLTLGGGNKTYGSQWIAALCPKALDQMEYVANECDLTGTRYTSAFFTLLVSSTIFILINLVFVRQCVECDDRVLTGFAIAASLVGQIHVVGVNGSALFNPFVAHALVVNAISTGTDPD